MLTVMIVGLAMGSTVTIGKAVGAKHSGDVSKTVGNTITLFMVVSVICTVLLLFLVDPIVAVMSTPAKVVSETATYLTICFIGITFITAYNIISSIFRGMGDSKLRCILLRSPAQQISYWTICLSGFFIWEQPELHLEQR